ncbi:unnamed protein product [Didymodactylos carnosus]|uniref:Ankyrin repeat protein n=1 Tax=Didymodactylos carnosus TaxID=1234261 RepID=A0A814RUP2_9BILA|nr:unnamed protein product [Didymodactylos carnosus]CAF3902499.1 unnamed protein product [Didymodactylos carnosus]
MRCWPSFYDLGRPNYLVKVGAANINARTFTQRTPLYTFLTSLRTTKDDIDWEKVDYFIKSLVHLGCEINQTVIDKTTVLHFAAEMLPVNCCQSLLEANASISVLDYFKRTTRHPAAKKFYHGAEIIKLLYRYGADIHAQDSFQYLPAHYAAAAGNFSASKQFASYKTNLEAKGNLSITPLHLAADVGYISLLSCFLNFDVRDEWQATPLHYAAYSDNV